MRVSTVMASPIKDKAELLYLEQRIFSTDRFDSWEGYQTFFIQLIEADQRVGTIAFVPHLTTGKSWDEDAESRGTLWLVSIGVLPEFEGLGIATHAMRWGIIYARASGFYRITSNFRVGNSASRRLHEKCGFKPLEIIPDYYRNPTEDAQVVEIQF